MCKAFSGLSCNGEVCFNATYLCSINALVSTTLSPAYGELSSTTEFGTARTDIQCSSNYFTLFVFTCILLLIASKYVYSLRAKLYSMTRVAQAFAFWHGLPNQPPNSLLCRATSDADPWNFVLIELELLHYPRTVRDVPVWRCFESLVDSAVLYDPPYPADATDVSYKPEPIFSQHPSFNAPNWLFHPVHRSKSIDIAQTTNPLRW